MKNFNEVALTGNTALMGFFANGFVGAAISTVIHGFSPLLWSQFKMMIPRSAKELAFDGEITPSHKLYDKIHALKNEMGINKNLKIYMKDEYDFEIGEDKDTAYLCMNSNFVKTSPEDQILDIVAHEFGHLLKNAGEKIKAFGYSRNPIFFFNVLWGGANSVLNLNLIPVLGVMLTNKSGKFFFKNYQRLEEHKCDDYVAEYRDAKNYVNTFFDFFQRSDEKYESYVLRALGNQFDFNYSSLLGGVFKNTFLAKPVASVMGKIQKLESETHPSNYKRISRISKIVQQTEPDFKEPQLCVGDHFKVCADCMQLITTEQQDWFRFFLENEVEHDCGHRNIRVIFTDSCENPTSVIKNMITAVLRGERPVPPQA